MDRGTGKASLKKTLSEEEGNQILESTFPLKYKGKATFLHSSWATEVLPLQKFYSPCSYSSLLQIKSVLHLKPLILKKIVSINPRSNFENKVSHHHFFTLLLVSLKLKERLFQLKLMNFYTLLFNSLTFPTHIQWCSQVFHAISNHWNLIHISGKVCYCGKVNTSHSIIKEHFKAS